MQDVILHLCFGDVLQMSAAVRKLCSAGLATLFFLLTNISLSEVELQVIFERAKL